MSRASTQSPSKLSLWVTMLLVWNIALLCIALFFLVRITKHPVSAHELAALCTEQFLSLQE